MATVIIPQPHHFETTDGAFTLTAETTLAAEEAAAAAAAALRRVVGPATGFALPAAAPTAGAAAGGSAVRLAVDGDRLAPEAYELTVTPERIDVVGGDAAGAFYGVQSLCQLLPPEIFGGSPARRPWTVSCCRVQDRPRHRWRGAMLDVARHFMPVEFLLRLVDLLALHKLNSLHLHLTDDQGWRLPVPGYPKLTEVGAWRTQTLVGHARRGGGERRYDGARHGGFYTTEELRRVVAYAAERFVSVVPEIDMPGHMQSAVASYPELGNGTGPTQVATGWGISTRVLNVEDKTLQFCRDVLAAVMDIFPSKFVHCGGDEVPKTEWQASAAAQGRMRALGLPDEDALQAWFTAQMATYLSDCGRRFVGWDEVLEGGRPEALPDNVVVMSWRSEDGGITAARAGRDVVMAPASHLYFDYYQSADWDAEPLAIGGHIDVAKVYGYEPVPAALAEDPDVAAHVLGAQAQLWTEYVPTPRHAEYMLFPRLTAFADAVWRSHVDPAGFAGFRPRLQAHLARLDALGVHYRPL